MSSTSQHIDLKINSIKKTLKKLGQMVTAFNDKDEAPTLLCSMQLIGYHTTDGENIHKGKPNGKNRKPVSLKIKTGINEEAIKQAFGMQSLVAWEQILQYGIEKYSRENSVVVQNAIKEAVHDQKAAEQLTINIPTDTTTEFIKNY